MYVTAVGPLRSSNVLKRSALQEHAVLIEIVIHTLHPPMNDIGTHLANLYLASHSAVLIEALYVDTLKNPSEPMPQVHGFNAKHVAEVASEIIPSRQDAELSSGVTLIFDVHWETVFLPMLRTFGGVLGLQSQFSQECRGRLNYRATKSCCFCGNYKHHASNWSVNLCQDVILSAGT
eukprot:6463710-Amphidinium_carterae.1